MSRHKSPSVRPGGNRGIALLLVVSVISLLTVVIVQFGRSMRTALVESSHYQDRELLEAAVQSGIDIGCAVLRSIGNAATLIRWSRRGLCSVKNR